MRSLIRTSKRSFSKRFPSVSFDVDGVLKRGSVPIPRAKDAIVKLRERGIPVSLITNGGGELEQHRGKRIADILKLEDKYIFKANEVFLCHTPMKDLIHQFKDKLILITGINNCEEVIENYGFKNYMTTHEYFTIFEDIVPLFSFVNSKEDKLEIKQKVEKRFGTSFNCKEFPQVHAIFMMTDVVNWEINSQVNNINFRYVLIY
jgi:HAD superfamily hydrolase (TIGR01450 family)